MRKVLFNTIVNQRRQNSNRFITNCMFRSYSTNLIQQRLNNSSTIYAVSSGVNAGKGRLQAATAVSLIRISGPKAKLVVSSMTRLQDDCEPRKAYFCKLKHPQTGQILDHALCLFFPGPNSFTGEDIVELHIHGGHSVQNDVLQALSCIDSSYQLAEPGDFTKRAFMNGKMDLTEVEALSDLLHAQTEQQRLQALRQLDGSLSKLIESWSHDVTYAVAFLTAFIDFGEDDKISDTVYTDIIPRMQKLLETIKQHLKSSHKGERLRSGVQVALVGAPNAGKSSLLNTLAKRPVAIVSDIQGTTRDIVEVHLNIGGYAVTVADTAGIRHDNNEQYEAQGVSVINDIEREGMNRALSRAKDADILMLVMDPLNPEANKYCLDRLKVQQNPEQQIIIVHNKSDLTASNSETKAINENNFFVSCKTNDGVDQLIQYLEKSIAQMFAGESNPTGASSKEEQLLITRERHRHHLQSCVMNLILFLQYYQEIDIAAEYLRTAHSHLAAITGHVDTEDILGIVFKEFCIGK
jgi:tRNA modification GTPase